MADGIRTQLDGEKGKQMVRIINRFSRILRQTSAGEYRDEFVAIDASVRIQYRIHDAMRILKKTLEKNVPDLDGLEYQERLTTALINMRGRELPGFTSTRLLLSTVSSELESWRSEVDDALRQMFDIFIQSAATLAHRVASQARNLERAILETVRENCEKQFVEMGQRVEDMFMRSAETAAGDTELVSRINQLRSDRFEASLREMLTVAKDPSSATDGSASSAGVDASSVVDLKQHVLDMLGSSYMQQHGLGNGPNLHPDDARAALKAYWRVSYGRLNEDIAAAVELLLLQRCTEMIENDLLARMQGWLADESALAVLLADSTDSIGSAEVK